MLSLEKNERYVGHSWKKKQILRVCLWNNFIEKMNPNVQMSNRTVKGLSSPMLLSDVTVLCMHIGLRVGSVWIMCEWSQDEYLVL